MRDIERERFLRRQEQLRKKRQREIRKNVCIMVGMIIVFIVIAVALVKISSNHKNKGEAVGENSGQTPVTSEALQTSEEPAGSQALTPNATVTDAFKEVGNSWYNPELYTATAEPMTDAYFANVCFLGDSRTKGMLEYTNLPEYHGFYEVGYTSNNAIINSHWELPGDTSGKTYNMLEIIEKVDYDIYYVGFGTNDLYYKSADTFLKFYTKIIDKLIECHPDAIIYVENVMPVSEDFERKNPMFLNSDARLYNAALRDLCIKYKNLVYVDIASIMWGDDGYVADGKIADGIHYTKESYREILDYLLSHVVQKNIEN